jgi:hypothetical protein
MFPAWPRRPSASASAVLVVERVYVAAVLPPLRHHRTGHRLRHATRMTIRIEAAAVRPHRTTGRARRWRGGTGRSGMRMHAGRSDGLERIRLRRERPEVALRVNDVPSV